MHNQPDMTTAVAIGKFYTELTAQAIPEFVIAELVMFAGRQLIEEGIQVDAIKTVEVAA